MAASSYYNFKPVGQDDQEHLLFEQSHPHVHHPEPMHSEPRQSPPLKQLHLVTNMDNGSKRQSAGFEAMKLADAEDKRLKSRIRHLRLLSRTLTLLLSIATFVPLALTLHTYLTTRNTYHFVFDPNNHNTATSRTAWHRDSVVWPTWMYAAVSGLAILLNLGILVAYRWGVQSANRVAAWVLGGNMVSWGVAVGVYRGMKKEADLWGWSCSEGARAIQEVFRREVDFRRTCNIQSLSWYVGLGQVASIILMIIIYVLVFMRKGTKRKAQRNAGLGFEETRL